MQALAIPSSDTAADRDLLRQVFGLTEGDDGVLSSEEAVLYLVPTTTSGTTVLWLAERAPSSPRLASYTLDDHPIWILNLPGGSRILRITPELLLESSTRSSLARVLQGDESLLLSTVPLPTRNPVPSLKAQLRLPDGSFTPFPLNAQTPFPISNDLFEGHILLLIQHPTDSYWNERLFDHKQRRLALNIQGKFKRVPQGTLLFGGHLTEPMKVGLLTRGVLGFLVQIIERIVPQLEWSFGSSNDCPKIVAPAALVLERLVVTPPGDTPPPLNGDAFDGGTKTPKRNTVAWNTTHTYSMSYYTKNADLANWKVVQMPTGDIRLASFWGDAALQLVLYDERDYVFCIQLDHRESSHSADETTANVLDLAQSSQSLRRSTSEAQLPATPLFNHSTPFFSAVDEEDDFYDAEEETEHEDDPVRARKLLSEMDDRVPALMEVMIHRGTYTKAFAVKNDGEWILLTLDRAESLIRESPRYAQVARAVMVLFSPRLSDDEKLRRRLALTLQHSSIPPSMFNSGRKVTQLFLQPRKYTEVAGRANRAILAGFVARAVSDRHWIEEWCKVSDEYLAFYEPDKRRSQFRVSLVNILSVSRLAVEKQPLLPGLYFLLVETIGRAIYLAYPSEADRDAWLDAISKGREAALSKREATEGTAAERIFDVDNLVDEFLHRSSMFKCKHRRILNCGSFSFYSSESLLSPFATVAHALRLALTMNDEEGDLSSRHRFFSAAAAMKDVSVDGYSEDERLCFFLNLYHLVVMHAFLVLGPPGSSLKWISYFNNIAYQVGDDIFSLTELEHNIIRANMSSPANFFSRFVLPNSKYPVALRKSDFRVNFALNCGSLSNPSVVPIYEVETLEAQLQEASRLYLKSVLVTRKRSGGREDTVTIQLPRVCQWYGDDFGSSPENFLQKVYPLLKEEDQAKLTECWSRGESKFDLNRIQIKYSDYNFQCCPLKLAQF